MFDGLKRLFCRHEWVGAEGGFWFVVGCKKCGKRMSMRQAAKWTEEQAEQEERGE